MQTKVKDFLFELIHSLTKSEKRYFKLHASRHTIGDENNYVKLFDFIDRLHVYNESQVFEHFKGAALLNRFSITKKRLYDHILDSLDAFHSLHSVEAKLNKLIHSADILFNKGLYEQASRVLTSAEKLALTHQQNPSLFAIRRKRKQLLENQGYTNISQVFLKKAMQEDKELLLYEDYYNQLWYTKSELFIELGRKGKARSEQDEHMYRALLNELPAVPDVCQSSFEVNYLYHHIKSACFFALNDMKKSFENLKINCQLFLDFPDQLKAQPNKYFSLMSNAIFVAEKLHYTDESDQLLSQLKASIHRVNEQQSVDLTIKYFASLTSIELSLKAFRGNFSLAEYEREEIEQKLRVYGEKISPIRRAYIQFKIASLLLVTGQNQLALKWVNSILNDQALDASEDIRSYSHLLHMLIHIELNNKSIVGYLVKNTQRYLKSRNRLHAFERAFISFLTKWLKCTSRLEELDCWEELYEQLNAIKAESSELDAFDYFDLLHWAQAKYTGVAFSDLIQRNYRKTFG